MDIILLVVGLLLFVGLVVLHELGHAIIAKRNGVVVEEFGIGFPPRAWAKKLKSGVLLSLNWLPLGGFVKLKGEHDAATGKGAYGGASLWAKTKILLAGVVINWLTAVVIFTIIALVGMPQLLPNQFNVAEDTTLASKAVRIGTVVADSPAAKAGLQPGDELVAFAGQDITGAEQFKAVTSQFAGQTQTLTYRHKDLIKETQLTLNTANTENKGLVGVGPYDQSSRRATWSAPIVGVGTTVQFTWETLKGLGGAIANLFTARFSEAGASVTGPIGIFSILSTSAQDGFVPVLFLIGVISLTLAVMNILPIPALDGGRLFVTLLFRALKRPLTKDREESIQAAGMIALLGLMLLITLLDVKRFF
ncbi:MAG TPA: M50 family metallopeptidase [Magnetospirillaceae bacterium]|nr:M50 family metallopeptidase [Magnetospirillaceae bacterium]